MGLNISWEAHFKHDPFIHGQSFCDMAEPLDWTALRYARPAVTSPRCRRWFSLQMYLLDQVLRTRILVRIEGAISVTR